MIARMLLHTCNARRTALGLQHAVTFEICLVIRLVAPLRSGRVQGQVFGKRPRVCVRAYMCVFKCMCVIENSCAGLSQCVRLYHRVQSFP